MPRKFLNFVIPRSLALSRALFAAATALALVCLPAHGAGGGEQTYKAVCMECHASGKDKAPKFGDRAGWAPLIKEGQARITADGWVGVRGMPAKGGKADLTLEDFAQAVAFMARAGGAKWADPDAAMLERVRAQEKKVRARQAANKAAGK